MDSFGDILEMYIMHVIYYQDKAKEGELSEQTCLHIVLGGGLCTCVLLLRVWKLEMCTL